MICSSTPSAPFSLSSSSGIPMIQILFHLIASHSSLILPSYSWIYLSLFFSASSFSIILSSNSPILSSDSSIYAMAASILFCTSFIAFFNSSWLFFSPLISVAIDSLLSSMLYLSPAINFMTIILNSFSVILLKLFLINSLAVSTSWNFVWGEFFRFVILASFLSLMHFKSLCALHLRALLY